MKNYVDEKQFKADIRKYAQQNHISGNEIGRLWQEVMLDDLLKRISLSKYKDNFILSCFEIKKCLHYINVTS
ncbi:MAG: hypothetical protein N4Q01_01250 [Lactobacillus iners]|nr:hypothetical protein [Lactobacillus iners]MCT7675661.1 hypothetical protein [Lactobacillus iners]MCT7737308.1 hypothetical protein [Lactobacillus iners]MCT7809289.1 hypothetical protein [Lactobacillus iners]MCT7833164.1 hypothetical protein [Lactobacillus iners]MCT7838429.1 hypothetical protein [Lactobacillus iners]